MTINIDAKQTFRGVGLLQVRALLRAWRKDHNPIRLRYLKTLPDDSADIMGLLQDALEANLIGLNVDDGVYGSQEAFGLTGGGKALAFADASKRVTRDAALKVLSNIVAAAEALSKDPKAPLKVSKIWVFGSVINANKADVGDLDIAFETVRTRKWKSSYGDMARYIDTVYPGLLPESHDGWDVDSDFVRKSIFGPRKNRLISETDVGILMNMHVPCALVYDQKRGRISKPKVLDHHPESKGRGDNIFPRRVMPELPPFSPFEFKPVNAVILSQAERYSRRDATVRLVTDLDPDARSLIGDVSTFDGSSMFAIAFKDHLGRSRPYHYLVTRSLVEGATSFEYRCSVEFRRIGKSTLGIQFDEQNELARAVAHLCQADASRLARRHNELRLTKQVKFIPVDVGRNIPLWNTANLAEGLAAKFKERVLPGLIRLPTPPARPVPGPPRSGQINSLLLERINGRKAQMEMTVDEEPWVATISVP